jgi:hypothetical protein
MTSGYIITVLPALSVIAGLIGTIISENVNRSNALSAVDASLSTNQIKLSIQLFIYGILIAVTAFFFNMDFNNIHAVINHHFS